jgi:hypothetical protein
MSGGTEVMCAMKPRTNQDRDELLLDRLPRTRRVTSVDAYCVLHHFYGGPLGRLSKVEELFAYLADEVGSIRGVRAVESVPTLRQVKTLTYVPRR